MSKPFPAIVALVGLALSTPGCLTYSLGREPTVKTYAKIAAIEVASAALLALVPDDDPKSDYSQTSYPVRAGVFLLGAEMFDALIFGLGHADTSHFN
jgi:hypothetical protein